MELWCFVAFYVGWALAQPSVLIKHTCYKEMATCKYHTEQKAVVYNKPNNDRHKTNASIHLDS
ncbi:hypothetical protein Lste_1705 [Legionella steelei]|uniref:Uncharacterized protein n=1 Tax=Legionella steelei TaxID=947033 RepID=A0A0W0ZIA2_9GAMM|nr:hypothetical protein Lste_1705 [Legionella steelei]